jgi:hypothetical protein
MSIYVEILIRGSMDDLWRLTQSPELHQRWDLRFTTIEYQPRPSDEAPQRFDYETRIGFGVAVRGEGETTGSRDDGGVVLTSALKFWSDDPKSLIRDGAGYWQYAPQGDAVRFLTSYDYRVRFGLVGRALDAIAFRPLLGWATAWSFDSLRLWIERGVDPLVSRQRALVHAVATLAVSLTWIYQGAVPKLLFRDGDEIAMLIQAGVAPELVWPALMALGVGEAALGLATLVLAPRRWMFGLTMALMLLATVGVARYSPQYLARAFNPVSLNVLMAAMAAIGWHSCRDLPMARRCRRSPEQST